MDAATTKANILALSSFYGVSTCCFDAGSGVVSQEADEVPWTSSGQSSQEFVSKADNLGLML
eukprot:1159564-Pelagomonas_calceolata.AAC.3